MEDVQLREKSSSSASKSRNGRGTDAKSIRNLIELVKCDICNLSLNKARMLPCQHTFCLSCLQSSYDQNATDGNWNCPNCKRTYKFENRIALEELPTNVYLESIFDLLNESPSGAIPQQLSMDIRCIKCETVCEFQEQLCQHCKQIFCTICWAKHVNELITNLSFLERQLDESEIRLKHRTNDFLDRCEKLKINVEEAARDKIQEINTRKDDLLNEIQSINSDNQTLLKNLRKEIVNLKSEIQKLNINSLQADNEKITLFLEFHQKTSKLLEDVSKWGEFKPTLDRDALTIDVNCNGPFNDEKKADTTSTGLKSFKEGDQNNAVILHYKTFQFSSKLYWNKCPRPAGVAVPPWDKNILYICTTDNKIVLIFDMQKTKVLGRLSDQSMSCPYGVTFCNARKEIYVTDKWNHCIHVYESDSNYSRTLCNDKPILLSPEGIAMSSNGRLFVCDTGNDRVIAINPLNGELIMVYGQIGGMTELCFPTGVAVRANTVYVADTGNHRIKVYTANGEKLLEIGAKGQMKGQLKSPVAVAVDHYGCILVGDSGNSRLQVFKPDGSLIRTIGEYGNMPGKFLWISGLAITENNDIIFTDSKNRTLQVF